MCIADAAPDAELDLICLTWNAFGLANFGNLAASSALHRGLLYAGVYRQWEDTLGVERERPQELIGQLERAA
jgi:hypothetical protein